jgi:hypothetical protein
MGDIGMPHGVLQAVWSFGRLTLNEKACLAVACGREACRWSVADAAAQREAVLRFKSDPFSRAIYFTHHPLRVSRWRKAHGRDCPGGPGERPPPPALPRGCAVNIYIDEADAETLGEICDWLGREVAPRHLFFWTYYKRGPRRMLTDEMLLACAWDAETIMVSCNELITDVSVSRLRKCRDIRIEHTGVSVSSIRDLPDLLHVHCNDSTDVETIAWVKHMHDNKLILMSMY